MDRGNTPVLEIAPNLMSDPIAEARNSETSRIFAENSSALPVSGFWKGSPGQFSVRLPRGTVSDDSLNTLSLKEA